MKLKITLIDEARQWWTLHSLWAGLLLLLVALAMLAAPYVTRAPTTQEVAWVTLVCAIGIIAARYYQAENKARLWRAFTVVTSAALAVLSVVQTEVLPSVQPVVPAQAWPWVVAVFGVAIPLLRLVKQASLHDASPGGAS